MLSWQSSTSYRLYKVMCHLPNKVKTEGHVFLDAPWKHEEDIARLEVLFGAPLSLADDKGVPQKETTHAYKEPQLDVIHVAVTGKVIHEGITCSKCEAANIEGIRYKCKNCASYDLCAKCCIHI